MVDLRHETIFFYIIFCSLWFLIITPMLTLAQEDAINANSSFTNSSIYVNATLNDTGLEPTQLIASINLVDFTSNLINFHFSIWYIDVFIVGMGAALLTYSGLSLIPPGG